MVFTIVNYVPMMAICVYEYHNQEDFSRSSELVNNCFFSLKENVIECEAEVDSGF